MPRRLGEQPSPDRTGEPEIRGEGPPEIIACPDGPLLVRGDVALLAPDGTPLPRRRGTLALCRCGRSRIKPFCDGTHKLSGFRTGDEGAH